MFPPYLSYINRQRSSFTGIEIIGSGANAWYSGNYNTVKKNSRAKASKVEIVALVNQAFNRNTKPGEWEWHHVVEGQHIKTILVTGSYEDEYDFKLPTILIHDQEHKYFSQNFNTSAFRELTGIAAKNIRRGPKQEIRTPDGREMLRHRLDSLRYLYNEAYRKYPTLKRIANNVFDYHAMQIGS